MSRNPAAHRLATKKARQERAWRRALYRMPLRYVTGIDSASVEEWGRYADRMPLMVLPEPAMSVEYRRHVERAEAQAAYDREFHTSRYPVSMLGVTAEEWAEHMRKAGQAYGVSLSEQTNENEEA
jgi:hypothetical protein